MMARVGPFDGERRVMAAVSGGADSMALAVLLADWGRPLAAVVDHGLRAESAAEAAVTVSRLATLGVQARVLKAGLAPGPAAAERARQARYWLLLQACREAGCADLVLAHHEEDQGETVLIRAERGSGAAGLAGMAAVAYRAEARLLRPLLDIPRARLRATLDQAGVGHADDPTNHDPRTARGRLRARPLSPPRAGTLAAGKARAEAERRRAAELAGVTIFPEGYAVAGESIGTEALAALVWTVSGAAYPPPRKGVGAGAGSRTLHGVVLRRLVGGPGGVLVAREPAAVAGPVAAEPGVIWDGRFRLQGSAPSGCVVAALGDLARTVRRRSRLPSLVLRTLPGLWRDGALIGVPALGIGDPGVMLRFAPTVPLAGAPFVNLPAGKGAVD